MLIWNSHILFLDMVWERPSIFYYIYVKNLTSFQNELPIPSAYGLYVNPPVHSFNWELLVNATDGNTTPFIHCFIHYFIRSTHLVTCNGERSEILWMNVLVKVKIISLPIFSCHHFCHGLRTPNEGINQRNLKIWADWADIICFRRT